MVAHCHGTCLRQMELCPHLAPEAIAGCQRLDRYAVLHEGHAVDLVRKLGVERKRIDIVGAGFRDDLFHIRGRKRERGHDILYAGKFSNAKGLPWLLDAFEQVQRQFPGARLHIAGGGSGQEAGDIRARMETMAPHVVLHGMLSQAELSELMRRCDLFVLPSFYEGLPLVLIEALASGCRLVSTNLPCMDQLREHIAPALDLVKLPRLVGPDTPVQDDLPRFITNLCEAITLALTRPSIVEHAALHKAMVEPYTWDAVCIRTESVWRRLIGTNAE